MSMSDVSVHLSVHMHQSGQYIVLAAMLHPMAVSLPTLLTQFLCRKCSLCECFYGSNTTSLYWIFDDLICSTWYDACQYLCFHVARMCIKVTFYLYVWLHWCGWCTTWGSFTIRLVIYVYCITVVWITLFKWAIVH